MSAYILIPLIEAVFCIVLLVLLRISGLRHVARRPFAFFLVFMGLWGFFIFMMRSSSNLQGAFFWEKFVFVAILSASLFFYRFTISFTSTRQRKEILYALYFLYIAFLALIPTGLVVSGMQIMWYGKAPIVGPLFFPYVLLVYVPIGLGLRVMIKHYRKSRILNERIRDSYIITGITMMLIGGTTDYFPPLGLNMYPLGIIGNIAFCVLATVAMLRYGLLEIRVALRRGVSYSVVSMLTLGVFVSLMVVLSNLFEELFSPASLAIAILVVFAVAAVFQPVLSRVQHMVDRWFYRERYDHLKTLEQFSQESKSIIDLGQLSSSLIRVVKRAMQTEKVYLLIRSSQTGAFTVVSSSWTSQSDPPSLKSNNPIVNWLSSRNEILRSEDIDVSPQLQALRARQQRVLVEMGGEIYVPLRARDGLAGILVLGSKLSKVPYDGEDTRLLSAVTSQAAIALENAQLYRDLARQLEKLKTTQTQLMRSAKLAAVGELAANIAHEINNPLQSILNYNFILSQGVNDNNPRKADLEALENEALRAQGIVRSLLDFARRDEPKKEEVEVNSLLQSVVPLAKLKTEASGIRLVEDYAQDMLKVDGDAEQLKQVFLNLATNAIDAMSDGGKLTILTKNQGEQVRILFSDTGKGIPAKYLPKIFDPFFTTKPKAKGTGLGLTVSLSIVEDHNGTISVDSEQGKGSTFTVTLPSLNIRG